MEALDFLREFGLFKAIENALDPPWSMFPGISPLDMFWRMGKGEDYMSQFSKYYDLLNERQKTVYRLTNPQPYNWPVFYNE